MYVLFLHNADEETRNYIQSRVLPEVQCVFPDEASEEQMLKMARQAEVMVGWRPEEAMLAEAKNLRLFMNPGVGVQHLIPLFRRYKEVTLANCHGNTPLVAQHALALTLSLTNQIVRHHQFMEQGRWRTGDREGASIPLRHLQLGLLGMGAIARHFLQYVQGFHLQSIGCRRNVQQESSEQVTQIYPPEKLHDFLAATDLLLISLPLTTETEGLLGTEELKLLGEQGLLVNVGRGPVVKEEALYMALKEKTIAGAGLDVWYDYSPTPDGQGREYPYSFPFHELDNVVLSPHRAASPMNDLPRWDEIIENINRTVRGEEWINVIDLEREY